MIRIAVLVVLCGCVGRPLPPPPDAAPPDGPEQFRPTDPDPEIRLCLNEAYLESVHECRNDRLPTAGRPPAMSLDDCLRLWRRGWPGGPTWPTVRPFGGYEAECRSNHLK